MKNDIQFSTKGELLKDAQIKYKDEKSILESIKDCPNTQMLMIECEIASPITVTKVTPVTDEFLEKTFVFNSMSRLYIALIY